MAQWQWQGMAIRSVTTAMIAARRSRDDRLMASTSRCIASSSWLDSAVRTLETMARILLRWLVFWSLSSRFK
jgi:hypothetical protein